MITQERALEKLERFDIDEDQLHEWETELELEIPLDKFGNKIYSPLHINLFKNIKKHITLGRHLKDIKRMIVLPSTQDHEESLSENPLNNNDKVVPIQVKINELSAKQHDGDFNTMIAFTKPVPIEKEVQNAQIQLHEIQDRFSQSTLQGRLLKGIYTNALEQESLLQEPHGNTLPENNLKIIHQSSSKPYLKSLKRFASVPANMQTSTLLTQPGSNAGLVMLIDRLIKEKDDLQAELKYTEKQNSHLLQVNKMFQQRVQELTQDIDSLEEQLRARENLKLIDDKSRLQKKLIEAEHQYNTAEKKLSKLDTKVKQLEDALSCKVSADIFVGNWLEEADLKEVVFDNFGINIESKRNRMFKITTPPARFFGRTAIIETLYDYQSNTLWKRTESLVIAIINDNHLEGEMIIDYILDGTPVAKANYRVKCYRNGVKSDS